MPRRCTGPEGWGTLTKGRRERDYEVGHGRTPATTRFRKEQSGNPNGRPKGRHNQPPYETVLGQRVVIRERGVERRVTTAEAFLLHMTKRGLDGDGAAARSAMVVIEEARARRGPQGARALKAIVRVIMAPGSVNTPLEPLQMATKLDRCRENACRPNRQ